MFNQVILMGRLVKAPEVKQAKAGNGSVFDTCRVSIAVERPKKQGQDKADVDYIQLAATGTTATNMGKYLDKGCRVHVTGSWRSETYNKSDGTKGYLNECTVKSINFIDFKKADGAQPADTGTEFATVENPDDLPFL